MHNDGANGRLQPPHFPDLESEVTADQPCILDCYYTRRQPAAPPHPPTKQLAIDKSGSWSIEPSIHARDAKCVPVTRQNMHHLPSSNPPSRLYTRSDRCIWSMGAPLWMSSAAQLRKSSYAQDELRYSAQSKLRRSGKPPLPRGKPSSLRRGRPPTPQAPLKSKKYWCPDMFLESSCL
ncbi:hypothetical protein U1Q18_038227 [Sarracenia purpurea var. burkii]